MTATGAAASAPVADLAFESVCIDSRAVAADTLFVALRGAHHDAHRFVADALRQGAVAALVEEAVPGADPARLLRVPDTLRALGDLAAYSRRRWGGPVAAITGSNGKTTTKEMLAAIAAADSRLRGRTLATHGNLNNLIGLPLTVLRLRGDEAAAILEMGMNAPGEIARMTEIAAPTIGVITNVGPAHLEGLGTIEGVAAAKGELFAGLGPEATIAVNRDDPHVVRQAARFTGRRIEFGHGGEVWADAIDDRGFDGVDFTLCVGAARARVRLRMAGRHNVQNGLAAAAVAHGLGLDLATIAAGLC
ncbi:MAG: UDP-N-acetylmuramoyl-tripeptide--D-alanyl-D-alanine ligase, partial [Candidatus Binatia bacterium]